MHALQERFPKRPKALQCTMSLPENLVTPCQTTYRSVGLGVYAVVVRYCTMPLEKVAMIANSSLVSSGSNQLGQAWKIATKEGLLAPYRTVGPASITAWFLQYSVMGFVFQTVDAALSVSLNTQRMPYGDQLMEPPVKSSSFGVATAAKAILAPVTAGTIESVVSNRAETQRFWGLGKSAAIERQLGWSALGRACGPAFAANSARNAVMSTTSFVATPLLFLHAFPQEHKSHSSLFWFGADAASLAAFVSPRVRDAIDAMSSPRWRRGGLTVASMPSKRPRRDAVDAFRSWARWTESSVRRPLREHLRGQRRGHHAAVALG